MIRPDYILTYWLLAWYFGYMVGIFTLNPKFALQLGLAENVLLFFAMLYFKVPLRNILFFLVVTLLFKVIPLWTIRNTKTTRMDIQATIGVLLMYIGWLLWEEDVDDLYKMAIEMKHLHLSLPGMYLLNKFV